MNTSAPPVTDDEASEDGDLSRDRFLDGRLTLLQPRQGYRAAIDPVFLAASIDAGPGESVLDVGTGAGAAALALAARLDDVRVAGIEIQRDLVRLAQRNIADNGLARRIDIMAGDLLHPPSRLAAASFHHVMMNPPYAEAGSGTAPPNASKARAHMESEALLADWIAFAHRMVRPRGSVTVIHRADRLAQILEAFGPDFGEVTVFPLWPGGKDAANKPAKRVLVRARRGVKTPMALKPGLVLHGEDGRYAPEAEAILRGAAALSI
ncbi:MAG: tRNA1(Val) (adenine(37)-N6)-methyltransferase [Rhodospirillales bacterium]